MCEYLSHCYKEQKRSAPRCHLLSCKLMCNRPKAWQTWVSISLGRNQSGLNILWEGSWRCPEFCSDGEKSFIVKSVTRLTEGQSYIWPISCNTRTLTHKRTHVLFFSDTHWYRLKASFWRIVILKEILIFLIKPKSSTSCVMPVEVSQ